MEWMTDPQIWIAFFTLTALEIVLGIDNIIFISILAGKLPQAEQTRARTPEPAFRRGAGLLQPWRTPPMTATTARSSGAGGLYPPTVRGAARPLPLRKFLLRFVRNPLCALPQASYEEGLIVHDTGRAVVAWVTDPALIERILLHDAERFPKTQLEKRESR